jgi:hypothetical protein
MHVEGAPVKLSDTKRAALNILFSEGPSSLGWFSANTIRSLEQGKLIRVVGSPTRPRRFILTEAGNAALVANDAARLRQARRRNGVR